MLVGCINKSGITCERIYIEKRIENSIERSIENSIENSIERSIGRSIEKSIEKSIERRVERSIDKVFESTVGGAGGEVAQVIGVGIAIASTVERLLDGGNGTGKAGKYLC